MRYLIRLLAVLAAATICLSPIALATAAHADGPDPQFQYLKQNHLAQVDSRNGDGGIVLPQDITPATPADTGVDAATVALLALLGAGLVVVGVGSAVVVRRQHHHLPHPA